MDTSKKPNSIFGYIEKSGITLLAGSTHSGKSVLVTSYLNYMAKKYSPEEWGVVALDLLGIDYEHERDNQYLIKRSTNIKNDSAMKLLEEMAFLAVDRSINKKDNQRKRITVHITECDVAQENLGLFLDRMNKLSIAFHPGNSGIQVIYETSRISEDTMPQALLDMADLRLLQYLPNLESANYFSGFKDVQSKSIGDTIIINWYDHNEVLELIPAGYCTKPGLFKVI